MSRYILVLTSSIVASTYAFLPDAMKSYVNQHVNPCNDFYRYACGDWSTKNPLQYDDTRITLPTMEITTRINTLLDEMIEKKTPIVSEYWDSCLAFEQITTHGRWPLQTDLYRLYKTQKSSDMMELAGEFARTGGSAFLKYQVALDPLNTKRHTFLLQPQFTLPDTTYYSDVEIRHEFGKYADKIMKMAGYSMTKAKLKRKREEEENYGAIVLKIENDLYEIQKQVGSVVDPMTFGDALSSWPHLVKHYTKGMRFLHSNQDLIIYGSFQYLQRVEALIERLEPNELRVYIAFRMIHSRILWLGKNFDIAWFILFRRTIHRQRVHRPRDRICRTRIREHLSDLIGKELYRKGFDQERQTTVVEMIKMIQATMEKHISDATWLDDRSEKKKAQEKLRQLTSLIGQSTTPRTYPLSLSRTQYAENMYKIMSHSFDEEMKKVGESRSPDEWPISSIELNAHYVSNRNAIVLPVGVLQPPLFHGQAVHPAQNFGAIGAIIGHELIHAFDASGSSYDQQGNQVQWWDPTNSIYTDGAKCFEKQYTAMQVRGRHIDGQLTLNENIADNGGLSVAWNAYRKYMTTVKPETNGVTETQGDRLFFIAFGQSLCERAREEIVNGNRSPGYFRLNGVVMNNPNFAKTFECHRSAPMNPLNKCVLW